MQQLTSIAIGNPTVGGFVLGGANVATSFTLTDWFPSVSRNQISISANFYIQSDDVDAFAALINASRELSSGSVSLGVSTKPAGKTITVDLTVSSQTLTLTRTAGDSFASTDVAMPINIDGVGSFMITEYVSASIVRCLMAPSLTAPSAGAGLTATIGTEFLRIDEVAKVGGFRSEVSIGENPDPDADETRKSYSLEAAWERPGNDSRGLDAAGESFANRRDASYRVIQSPSGLKTVEFSGTYTAGDGALAPANYASGVTAWANSVLAAVSPGDAFTKVGQDFFGTDDEGSLLTFNLTRKQINLNQFAGGVSHPAIENAQVRLEFNRINSHGLRGHNSPGLALLDYTADIVISEATEKEIADLYYQTVRPYLISVLASVYGSTVIVQAESGPGIDFSSNRLGASLTAIITGTGSNIIDYTKSIEYDYDFNRIFRKIHDGKGHTYHIWSPGPSLVSTVTVQVSKVGGINQSSRPAAFGINSGLSVRVEGGINQGALSIAIGRPGSNSSSSGGVQETFTEYPAPSSTPGEIIGIVNLPDGEWLPLKVKARRSPKYIGRPEDSNEDIEVSTYVQSFIWITPETIIVPVKPAQGRPTTGSEAGTLSTTVGGRGESGAEQIQNIKRGGN